MNEQIPFKLYPCQQKILEEMMKDKECYRCSKVVPVNRAVRRTMYIRGTGKPYGYWICKPCDLERNT